MQYIVTMNSDDLTKAESEGFSPAGHVLEPHLTDQPDGGLFGFRLLSRDPAPLKPQTHGHGPTRWPSRLHVEYTVLFERHPCRKPA